MNRPPLQANNAVGWISLAADGDGDALASELLDIANKQPTWSLESFGATVIRRKVEGRDQFLFSPHARPVFHAIIELRGAAPCDPPRTREMPPATTSRMLLGFQTRWEPFEAPRSTAYQGISRVR